MSGAPDMLAAHGHRRCLRRGIGRHRVGGGSVPGRGHIVVSVVGSHPVHHRPRQSRADAAQGRQGRSYSGALHLDAPEPRLLHGVWVDGGRDGSEAGCGGGGQTTRSLGRTAGLVISPPSTTIGTRPKTCRFSSSTVKFISSAIRDTGIFCERNAANTLLRS